MSRAATRLDADARLVRRTAIRVGLWLTIAVSVLVITVLVAAFAFVFTQVPLRDLFNPHHREEMLDVGGLDVLIGGIVIGLLVVALAGILGLIATRRAVSPLVDALGRQRRFVADASHELRTPLAILDTRLQSLQRSLEPDDPHRDIVMELRADSRNLIAVVADLLDSVDVPSDGATRSASVEQVVGSAVASMRMLAQDRGIRILIVPPPADTIAAIPDTSLHRALVALLDNAIKHSADDSEVALTVTTTRHLVRIVVTDHGSGIRGIAPERVFDRFARSSDMTDGGGNARTGFGIGLSLVQETAARFGGDVEVTDTSAAGTSITMRLPRAK